MTAKYPVEAQQAPPEDSIFFNCLNRIGRTGWDKTTAGRQERRDKILVASDKADEKDLGDFTYLHLMRHDNK
jgi:hypothetical protein